MTNETVNIADLAALVDHIEIDHEYEVAPATTETQIRAGHRRRHAHGHAPGHSHRGMKQGET